MARLARLACLFGAAEVTALGNFLDSHHAVQESFASFIQAYGRGYAGNRTEYDRRFLLYRDNLAEVHLQNSDPDRLWSADINTYSDWDDEELQTLRGRRHMPRLKTKPVSFLSSVSFAQERAPPKEVRENVSWEHLDCFKIVDDQGPCGSCWAIATAKTLEAYAILYDKARTFSTQQLVLCTENAYDCGGTGGCQGATAELAFDYALKMQIATEEDFRYRALGMTELSCPRGMQPTQQEQPQLQQTSFGMFGYERLPENEYEPLLKAVESKGPVVLSVAANRQWSRYSKGVMDGCGTENVVVNHAAVLIGYGYTHDTKGNKVLYWTIRNSWGRDWGEKGNIRLLRKEEKYCGMDHSPEDGTGCLKGPNKINGPVEVCGMCGMYYDNVVPNFRLTRHGLLHRSRQ